MIQFQTPVVLSETRHWYSQPLLAPVQLPVMNKDRTAPRQAEERPARAEEEGIISEYQSVIENELRTVVEQERVCNPQDSGTSRVYF